MTTKLISTVTRSAVSTAAHVARHPIGTATQAVTLVKGVAELGLDLVHGSRSQSPWTEADRPRPQSSESSESSQSSEAARTAEKAVRKTQEKVAEAAQKVEATAEEIASEKPAAAGAADKVAAGAAKVADTAEKAATEVEDEVEEKAEKTGKAKAEATIGKPAHEPAAGTAPTGEPVDTEAVRKDPEHESTPSAHDAGESEDPRDHIPGPDLATFAPPAPEDLPEPIVIEAE